jgi:hypothetical protein
MPQVNVDRLQIRLKGSAQGLVLAALEDLERQIRTQLAEQEGPRNQQGKHHLAQVHLDPITIDRGTTASELSAQIARSVVDAFPTNTKQGE